ncbi:hypothetical protein [Sphingobacterium multivorum]|uniref:hypothetical protein n=1 Tax=Sphingobacterium multivorum TaxID=28454 RepID=UPI003DA65DA3
MVLILTGKAKHDFTRWMFADLDRLIVPFADLDYPKNIVLRNALIIEWFDTVGIYLEIYIWHRDEGNMYFGWSIGDFDGCICSHDKLRTMSHQEATEAAIIKANDIYNETK